MNTRRTYVWTLIVFFLMWGVFGFAAAGLRSEPATQAAPPAVEEFSPRSADAPSAALPVTGEGQPEPRITSVHVLFGLVVVVGVLVLLNAVNKPATTYVRHKGPPDER